MKTTTCKQITHSQHTTQAVQDIQQHRKNNQTPAKKNQNKTKKKQVKPCLNTVQQSKDKTTKIQDTKRQQNVQREQLVTHWK